MSVLADHVLGEAIRSARLSKHMTQEELAEALNITPMHLRQIESERRRPSVEGLLHLAVILNLSLDALLFPEKAGGQEERAKLRRLADLYSWDDRFSEVLDSYGPGTARFMGEAIAAYLENL